MSRVHRSREFRDTLQALSCLRLRRFAGLDVYPYIRKSVPPIAIL